MELSEIKKLDKWKLLELSNNIFAQRKIYESFMEQQHFIKMPSSLRNAIQQAIADLEKPETLCRLILTDDPRWKMYGTGIFV